jgi:hypothetical protein
MHFSCVIGAEGPRHNVLVGITSGHRSALKVAGRPVPQPVSTTLLIDTGASSTLICESVIRKLDLTPRGFTLMHSPTTGGLPMQVPQYDVDLIITNPKGASETIANLLVMTRDMSSLDIDGLLGRDVLARSRMTYSGPENILLLSF